jgi:regulatory protein
VDEVVARAARTGLIDDTRYAEARVASLRRRGGSARAIQAKLAQKGVPKDAIAAALEGEPEDEHTAAHALARRRKLGPYRPGERGPYRDKDLAAMARAGFSYGHRPRDHQRRSAGIGSNQATASPSMRHRAGVRQPVP